VSFIRITPVISVVSGPPLFAQVAERLAADIADGGLAEGERVPSTNELAAFYRINPATAAKGINILADEGLLDKRRGIGCSWRPGRVRRCWPAGVPGSPSGTWSRCLPRRPGSGSTPMS
jgi:DNA-binding FadR family transcriptional regulator